MNKLTAWTRWAAAAVAFAALAGCLPTAQAASCTGTDTVERGGEPLAPDGGCVRVPVKAGGITTLRVTF